MNPMLENEPLLRLSVFAGLFAILAVSELVIPRRKLHEPKSYRWINNLSLVILNSLILRLVFPAAAVGAALLAENRQWGLSYNLGLPQWLVWTVSLLLLDFAIWAQHLLMHKVPLLWRLHRMHHADMDIDITTGLRFHPLEILLSMAYKSALIIALGIPPAAVLLFEIVLNGTSLFNHSNIRLPLALDRVLRWIVVTPDMHRVHHSWQPRETDSNYGFNLPWWDRLFGTYRDQPEAGHDNMTIGLHSFRHCNDSRLDRLLLQPFRQAE